MRVKLTAEQRRNLIVSEALEVAKRQGLIMTTLPVVSEHSRTPIGTVRYYFKSHTDLWRSVLAHPDATDALRQEGKKIGLQ